MSSKYSGFSLAKLGQSVTGWAVAEQGESLCSSYLSSKVDFPPEVQGTSLPVGVCN